VRNSWATQKLQWQEQKSKLEQEYKERKELLEKIREREEEEYGYALELKQRKEMDEYNDKKFSMEKELSDLKDNLSKREADLLEKEKDYESLRLQVQQTPDKIKEAVINNEKALEAKLLEQYEFVTKLKQQEYDGILGNGYKS
jgi:predicted nuclease with TOPRIM domain